MIGKIESGSISNKYKYNNPKTSGSAPSFNGLGRMAGETVLKGIQKCEEYPMWNVAVLDLTTAIIPRTFFETFIGSKKKDENGNETNERKLNFLAGFEALRREGSGLLINCMIPGAVVAGLAKLLNKPVMGSYNKSNLSGCWANSDAINTVSKYLKSAQGNTKQEKIYNTLKNMFDDIEGVNGNVSEGGMKKFREIFANDGEYEKALHRMANNILSDKPQKDYTSQMYKYMVQKTGIAENIKFPGDKGFFSSNLSHLCDSAGEILHGISREGLLKDGAVAFDESEVAKYLSKAKKLVNAKSIAGLGVIIPLAIAAQPINRWITHKIAGKKGAPIYNDDKERVLSPEDSKKLTAQKFIAIPLMWATTGLSMLMDKPSLKMFQFKNIFPTMDQARIISCATFSSRLAAAEDSNELFENTVRDIATFSSFYFLGDYAAKGVATYLEKHNKDGIKLINRLHEDDKNANVFKKFWNWAKHSKIKSTDELSAIADEAKRTKAKNLRGVCQLGNLAFSLLSLGVFIPIYTRTQTNKKNKEKAEAALLTPKTDTAEFTRNLIKAESQTFGKFFKE